jgi:hypothetical protein
MNSGSAGDRSWKGELARARAFDQKLQDFCASAHQITSKTSRLRQLLDIHGEYRVAPRYRANLRQLYARCGGDPLIQGFGECGLHSPDQENSHQQSDIGLGLGPEALKRSRPQAMGDRQNPRATGEMPIHLSNRARCRVVDQGCRKNPPAQIAISVPFGGGYRTSQNQPLFTPHPITSDNICHIKCGLPLHGFEQYAEWLSIWPTLPVPKFQLRPTSGSLNRGQIQLQS